MILAGQDLRNAVGRGRPADPACPACSEVIPLDAKWCPACHFSGADTMERFTDPPPPLKPVLDAAGIWTKLEIRTIESARQKLSRRFPQFRFHVLSVSLPEETSLPVFAFWLLNASPLGLDETAEDRAWSVMLLIDADSGRSAVVPGYSAERWLGDSDWEKALCSMGACWRVGQTAGAVKRFFQTSLSLMEQSWEIRGLRGKRKVRS